MAPMSNFFLMVHRLILKVTKFQFPPPKRLRTAVKTFSGGHHASNRVKLSSNKILSRIQLEDLYNHVN